MKITAVLLLDGLMKKWRFKILLLCMSVSFCSNRNIFLIMNMSNLLPKQHAWKIKKILRFQEGECRYTQKTQIPVSLSISRGEIDISNHGFQPSLRNHHEGSRWNV